MRKILPLFFLILFFFFFKTLLLPSLALAQNRAGINIGTRFSEAGQAISVVGRGGWLVVIAGGTGDCEVLQQIISQTEAAGVNLIIRGHLGNYLTPPDALGWTATLGSLNNSQKVFFIPWNEPNQAGSADWGDPADVAAYTAALQQNLNNSGVRGKTALLSPMLNQTWIGGTGDFDNYVNQLRSTNNNYFADFDGISLNLYDLSQQVCGQALCSNNPHFNPAKFPDILAIMGASGQPVFGVESGTAGDNFYWKQPPSSNSPLYQFVNKFLNTSHPNMFAIPAYDLAGEVGHTWNLFEPPDVTNLLAGEPDGNTSPISFDQAGFQAWLQSLLSSGQLISCGNSCGYASSQNPGLCTATGEPISGLTETSLTDCVLIDQSGGHGSENSSPIYIQETVTYRSDENGTQPTGDDNRCFDVGWTGRLQLVEDTFELPWAYYLNQYFLGSIDIHRVPPEVLDPLQLKLYDDILSVAGPMHKITPQQLQDQLKNDFLKETVDRINQSRAEGEPKTAYISDDLSQVFTIGPWDLEQIYYFHNVYNIRSAYQQCLKESSAKDCHHIIAQVDDITAAVWQLVPFFANEMTEGQIDFSAVDMQFDPNPVKTKNPEVYRLNKITKFLHDFLQSGKSTPGPATVKKGIYGDGEGLWEQTSPNSWCYNASLRQDSKKESSLLIDQNLSSYNYEATVVLNFASYQTHMGIRFRSSVDEEIRNNAVNWAKFAGIKDYNFSLATKNDKVVAFLWKTTPPNYLLNDPISLGKKEYSAVEGRKNYEIKIWAFDNHIKTYIDFNSDGLFDETTEKIFDLYDSDFPRGDIGFSIYDPDDRNYCFTKYTFKYLTNPEVNIIKTNQNKLISNLKTKLVSAANGIIPDKLKNLLASTKLFQPLVNYLAQAGGENCFHLGAEALPSSAGGGVNVDMVVKLYSDGKDGHFWLYVNGAQTIGAQQWNAQVNNPYVVPPQYTGSPVFVPIGQSRVMTYGARVDSCWNDFQQISCTLQVDNQGNFTTNCGQGAPVFPGECKTPDSIAVLPDPEAFYDLENYTPDMCLIDSVVNVEGKRSVKNDCPYRIDPLTGLEIPQTCTDALISAINVTNTTPWLTTVSQQTINIDSGFFRDWDPDQLYTEEGLDNPFRPVPAKDQVAYSYNHTGGDPRIQTSMLPGPWDLLFAYLGGVVNSQKWLTSGFLNPLKGYQTVHPPAQPPGPGPSSPPGPGPNPSNQPGPSTPPGTITPPPPTPISPPENIGFDQCAKPLAYVVNDPDNKNYVFGQYQGSLERDDANAHADLPYLATIVEWPDQNFRFVFSQEAGANDPFYEFKDGSGIRFQFYEGAHGSGELYNRYGRLTANSKVSILPNSPADTVIVQWEYWDVNKDAGQQVNHAVEFYTFYPCGLVAREMKFLETLTPEGYSFEPIEAILMNPVASRWFNHVKKTDDWYQTLTLLDVYSDKSRKHFAKPIDGELNKSETKEEGSSLAEIENSQGKIFSFHLNIGEVFMIYGNRSGLPNETILDVGKSWGHPCFNHGIIGWINSEWEKCNQDNFTIYPNGTPLIGVNHNPENDAGGQHNFTLLGITNSQTGQTDDQLKNLAKDWLEKTNFFQ